MLPILLILFVILLLPSLVALLFFILAMLLLVVAILLLLTVFLLLATLALLLLPPLLAMLAWLTLLSTILFALSLCHNGLRRIDGWCCTPDVRVHDHAYLFVSTAELFGPSQCLG